MSADGVKKLTDENYEEFLGRWTGVKAIECSADWCNPCKQMEKLLPEIVKETDGKITWGCLNTDDCPKFSKKYKILSIPVIFFFREGKVIGNICGFGGKASIMRDIEKILK
jgi:thioredoxin 1